MHHKSKSIKKKEKHSILAPGLLVLMCCVPFFALAQDPGGGPDAPVDGGLSMLLAAGSAYGIKKYRSYKAAIKKEKSV
jgi:hypothetical protein